MPVRIYDLAKKLGIESKDVLAKAKDLGISQAKVPSSSLDKITAEFLEQQLAVLYPQPAPPTPAASAPVAITIPETPPAAAAVTETSTELTAAPAPAPPQEPV